MLKKLYSLIASATSRSPDSAPEKTGLLTAADLVKFENPPADARIQYGDDALQFGDLRLPPGSGPHPVVVFIHGGCWLAEYDISHSSKLTAALAGAGIATWSLEYRRVGDEGGGWPGTFQDIGHGTDHLRSIAAEYNLDLDRVIVMGHSAGGHLALWAAARPGIPAETPVSSTDPLAVSGVLALAPAADLGYRGQPFNWVTMPDQFTLAALDRLLRDTPSDRRLFAQVALISSHAPWVPIPRLVPWDELGDGTIFDDMALSGDRPEVVWRDHDRVRDQYRQSITYALETVFAYAMRHADNPPLMIVLGDHQAAGFIALDERPDVPVHVIGPPDLLTQLADWGWTPGLIPADDAPVLPMEAMRDLLLNSFSTQPGTGASLPPAANGG